ncbi:MAG: CDP-alcohol phosphatidyltransferase family protein [Candidatus Thorarchaeota archaeon]|jgi:phosphatidylglycerophosphate synthase
MSPSKFRVRGIFRGLVTAAARPLVSRNVKPDSITYVTVLMAMLAFLALSVMQSQPLYGLFVFLVGFLDGVDGVVARESSTKSKAGALTDSFIDKVSEVILLFAIAVRYETTSVFGLSIPLWVFLCLAGWLLTSYSRSRAESLGGTDLDIGPGARSERLLTLVIFSFLSLVIWGLVVVTFMGLSTAAYRFYHYKRELVGTKPESQDHHT